MEVRKAIAIILSVMLVTAASVFADKPQTACPLTGEKIDKEVYVDYEGSRVYFCCASCKEPFLKKPSSFLSELKEKGVVLEKTPNPQTHCLVMGGEINRQVFVDHNGKRIFFCCPGCVENFKSDPEGYLKKAKDKEVNLEDTPKG